MSNLRMSNWKELSNEILCELFEQSRFGFNSRDLVKCQLVCKNWRKHASIVLYHGLVFCDSWNIEKFTECMQNSSLESLVQKMDFRCHYEHKIPNYDERIISLIYKLAETCPNVKIFKGMLRASHWNALGEVAGSCWKQLKQLPEPQWSASSDQNTFESYYTIASVCRRTLTHITLPPTLPSSQEFKRILPLLPPFINLTHLTVSPIYRNPTLMDFDETIQQYPNLMCFAIIPFVDMTGERNPDFYKRYDVPSTQPHLKLKKLVAVTELHCDMIDYIMHKFPNLECCNLYQSLDDEDHFRHMESWITSDYTEKLREF